MNSLLVSFGQQHNGWGFFFNLNTQLQGLKKNNLEILIEKVKLWNVFMC